MIPQGHNKQVQFMDACQAGFLGLATDTFGRNPDRATRAKAAQMVGARVRAYQNQPNQIAKAKFTTVSSDLPQMNTNGFDVIYAQQQYDLDWMLSFKEVPVDPGKNFFEIATIENGLSVQLVPEGGKLALGTMTGSKVVVYVNKYGQGIQWTDEMIRFRQLGMMMEISESQVEAHWADKADRHYTALYAAGSSNATTAYQTETGNTQVDNDIATLNQAYADALVQNKDKFRGLSANETMILYLPVAAKGRIERATKKLINDVQTSATRAVWNIRPVYTLNENIDTLSGDSFTGLLVLPGRKIQTGQVLAPTIYSEQDILSLSYIQTAWQYYGSAVAEITQTRLVSFD